MPLRIELSRSAAKRLQRTSGDLRARLLRKINELAGDPMLKGTETLEFGGFRRARVGGFRIVYTWSPGILRIEEIGTRGQIYRDLANRR